MRIRRSLCFAAAAFIAVFASCAAPRMPEPETAFDSIRDYFAWTETVGYPGGSLTDEGPYGINQDRFASLPGQPGYASGRIVIGDSRCCQLGMYQLRAGADAYAVFAVWGGHYTEREPHILTEEFYAAVEECFRAQVEAAGKCEIFFFATVNDYDHSENNNAGNIAAAVRCAETLSRMQCVHNGRTVFPTMTVIGIEGGRSSRYIPEDFNRFIASYNEALGSAVLNSPDFASVPRYTTVPEITGGNAGFIDDGLHYDDATLGALARFVTGQDRSSR